MRKTIMTILLAMFFTSVVSADIARPNKPKTNTLKKSAAVDTTLSVQLDRDAKEARLIIPRSQLKQLRAELDAIDGGGDQTAAAFQITNVQTIMSGIFLSLAFVFAGMWFARSGRLTSQTAKIVAGLMILAAGGAFVTAVLGNAGPPPEARSITGKMFSQAVHIYGFGSGRIKLEVSDEVSNPKLIVPNPPIDARNPAEE